MTSVIEDRRRVTPTEVETAFAEMLAQLLRVDSVSVDSHFFDDLGADSLVMAHFCARVRKRGDLPSVSMKDVYAHPTIRSLAAAVAGLAGIALEGHPALACEARGLAPYLLEGVWREGVIVVPVPAKSSR